jgi:hypothetical protein
MTRKFAEGIGYYEPIGDRGLVFTDEEDPRERMTLKYAATVATAGEWRLDTPVRGPRQGCLRLLHRPAPIADGGHLRDHGDRWRDLRLRAAPLLEIAHLVSWS